MGDREFHFAKLVEALKSKGPPTHTEIDDLADRQRSLRGDRWSDRDQEVLMAAVGAGTVLAWENIPADVRSRIVHTASLLLPDREQP
jgi:hypothetical protein